MSTRGAIGIRMNGIDKVGYNHFDSYPTGLGSEVLNWLSKMNLEKLKTIFDKIKFTDDWEKQTWDWNKHCLNLIFEDKHRFLYDSLFCEFAYIVNLDTNMLEFYIGFNKDLNASGRYVNVKEPERIIGTNDVYYGVKLEQEIPLQDIFDNKYIVNDEGFILKGEK